MNSIAIQINNAKTTVAWLACLGVMACGLSSTAGEPTLLRTIEGHKGTVYSVAFSPDGKILASGDENGTVKLWEAVTGDNVNTFITPKAEGNPDEKVLIRSLAFSPGGAILASGNTGSTTSGMIRLWDVTGGKVVATFSDAPERGVMSGIYSLVFSPNGKTLASGHEDNLIRIWNGASGSISTTIEADATDRGYAVAFSADGRMLASGGKKGTIKLWDVVSGERTATFRAERSGNPVFSIAFSPDGRLVGAGSWMPGGMLWELERGKPTAFYKFNPDPADSTEAEGVNDMAYSVAFSPDGKIYAVGCDNGIIGLWDIATRKKRAILHGHTALVRALDFHPNGKTLASGSDDSTVRLWSMN